MEKRQIMNKTQPLIEQKINIAQSYLLQRLEQLTVVCYQVIYRFQAAWLQGEFLDLVMLHLTMSSHFLLKEELMSVSVYVFNPV